MVPLPPEPSDSLLGFGAGVREAAASVGARLGGAAPAQAPVAAAHGA